MVILAAGLTPAWQQILCFERFCPGEVNRAVEAIACASGKVLNVGSALHHLGAASQTLSPVGGLTGRQILADFTALNVSAEWIETQAATRVCTTLLDHASGVTTELVENSAELTGSELEEFLRMFAEKVAVADFLVLTGSLPQRTPANFYSRLLELAPCQTLIDARGPELLACLPGKPWLIKPNREELSHTLGRPLVNENDLLAGMQEMQAAGAQHVVVSDGAAGLYAADPRGIEKFPIQEVVTINPIGCGDCLAAGIAVAVVEGRSWRDAVEFGIAAAAENASRLLPARFSRTAVAARLIGRA